MAVGLLGACPRPAHTLILVVGMLSAAPSSSPSPRHFLSAPSALSPASAPLSRCTVCLRTSQIDVCLMHNLQNPFVGTVHIFVDHSHTALQDSINVDGIDATTWIESDWRPPVLEGLEEKLAGEKVQLASIA